MTIDAAQPVPGVDRLVQVSGLPSFGPTDHAESAILGEMAKLVYDVLDGDQRRFFLDILVAGHEAFVATDYPTWETIFHIEKVTRLGEDDRRRPGRPVGAHLVRDYSGLYSLMSERDVVGEVDFDWGLAVVER